MLGVRTSTKHRHVWLNTHILFRLALGFSALTPKFSTAQIFFDLVSRKS